MGKFYDFFKILVDGRLKDIGTKIWDKKDRLKTWKEHDYPTIGDRFGYERRVAEKIVHSMARKLEISFEIFFRSFYIGFYEYISIEKQKLSLYQIIFVLRNNFKKKTKDIVNTLGRLDGG